MTPRRLLSADPALPQVLPLIRTAFAEMEGVIDPPSSMHAMTEADILRLASEGEVWAMGDPLAACIILTPQDGGLYAGRLAVHPDHRRQGQARTLLRLAEARARALHKRRVTLGCRVELTHNHALFRAEGYVETHTKSHEGYDRPTSV